MALFEAAHISVSYKREGRLLHPLDDVSFSLEAGNIYDITGPSGSGKSTLLLACARMIERESGTLSLEGRDSSCFTPERWRRRVCLVPQQATMFAGTVKDNLLFPWTLSVNSKAARPNDKLLEGLLELVLLDDVTLQTNASQLSGGQKARVALLRAFVGDPDVLLLDEVEAALDGDAAMAVSKLTYALVENGATCLRIRHRADDGFARGVFMLQDGHLAYKPGDTVSTMSFDGECGGIPYSRYVEVADRLRAYNPDTYETNACGPGEAKGKK